MADDCRQHRTPQPRPVWFLWHAGSFLLYSRPDTRKLEHIQRNLRVALQPGRRRPGRQHRRLHRNCRDR
ncbi:MAG: pyridoxamine 5'-phosphate oxidase family protein [Anaerolineae bacterium]|nr:pyridoxamine 5'-phosphate oxidase family protein [Anaerolineae bacterium]